MSYTTKQKLNFVTAITSLSGTLLNAKYLADQIYAQYFDNGYNSGGADELVVGDLAGSEFEGLDIADITAGITAIENLVKYFGNEIAVQADYLATYNQLKK